MIGMMIVLYGSQPAPRVYLDAYGKGEVVKSLKNEYKDLRGPFMSLGEYSRHDKMND